MIDEGESPMALYELRTYTLYVGKMAEATTLYQELGFPALKKGGHDKKLVGHFQADTGAINQLVRLWNSRVPRFRKRGTLESGSLMTTPTGGSTGQGSSPTRTSWKVLPRSSDRLS
jgi:NIPSNAP